MAISTAVANCWARSAFQLIYEVRLCHTELSLQGMQAFSFTFDRHEQHHTFPAHSWKLVHIGELFKKCGLFSVNSCNSIKRLCRPPHPPPFTLILNLALEKKNASLFVSCSFTWMLRSIWNPHSVSYMTVFWSIFFFISRFNQSLFLNQVRIKYEFCLFCSEIFCQDWKDFTIVYRLCSTFRWFPISSLRWC